MVSSSSEAIYGEAIWSPIDLLNRFLDDNPSSATRFGVWFIAASFIIAQVRFDLFTFLERSVDLIFLSLTFIVLLQLGYDRSLIHGLFVFVLILCETGVCLLRGFDQDEYLGQFH